MRLPAVSVVVPVVLTIGPLSRIEPAESTVTSLRLPPMNLIPIP